MMSKLIFFHKSINNAMTTSLLADDQSTDSATLGGEYDIRYLYLYGKQL